MVITAQMSGCLRKGSIISSDNSENPNIQLSSCDDHRVAYVAVYGENGADVGDGGKEVESVCAVSVIGRARDSRVRESGNLSEVREKTRGVFKKLLFCTKGEDCTLEKSWRVV